MRWDLRIDRIKVALSVYKCAVTNRKVVPFSKKKQKLITTL